MSTYLDHGILIYGNTNIKTMKTIKLIPLLVLALITMSCEKENSSKVDPNEPVYQELLVRYELHSNKTIAMATFRKTNESGVRLELTDNSKVLFNGKSFDSFSTLDSYFYQWSVSSIVDGRFEYTKNNGKVFINTISASDKREVGIPSEFTTVKLDGTTELTWSGKPIEANESISVFFKQNSENSGISVIYSVGSTKLNIPGMILSKMKAGAAKMYLRRSSVAGPLQNSDGKDNGIRRVEVEVAKDIIFQ